MSILLLVCAVTSHLKKNCYYFRIPQSRGLSRGFPQVNLFQVLTVWPIFCTKSKPVTLEAQAAPQSFPWLARRLGGKFSGSRTRSWRAGTHFLLVEGDFLPATSCRYHGRGGRLVAKTCTLWIDSCRGLWSRSRSLVAGERSRRGRYGAIVPTQASLVPAQASLVPAEKLVQPYYRVVPHRGVQTMRFFIANIQV